MANVLITGGAGFLGSHLCDRFIAEGDNVFCMDNFLTGSPENIAHLMENKKFKFIEYDVTNYIYVQEDLDYILHFASPASPIDYISDFFCKVEHCDFIWISNVYWVIFI